MPIRPNGEGQKGLLLLLRLRFLHVLPDQLRYDGIHLNSFDDTLDLEDFVKFIFEPNGQCLHGGDCGSPPPLPGWFSDYQPCSFWRWASFNLIVFSIWYWYIPLGIPLIPPLVGYLIDRRRKAAISILRPSGTVALMDQRSYRRRGMYFSCSTVLCLAAALFLQSASGYDGTCGGLWPGLGASYPCSFSAHMSFWLPFAVGVYGMVYGPTLAGVLLIAPLVGCLLDRRGRASVAQFILLFAALIFLAAPGVTWMVLSWRKANTEVLVTWWAAELLCVVAGAACMFVGSVLLDPVD